MRRSQGFSVVELIIVMAIIGVLMVIAVPDFLGYSPRARVKSAARDIVSNMQQARINAIKSSSSWAIQFDTGSACYRVLSDDGADDTWNTGDDTVYRTVNLSDYPGVSYGSGASPQNRPGGSYPSDGVSFSSNRVTFKSNGTSESGTVYVQNGDGDTFAVGSLAATGRIKCWHNYGSGWVPPS
ncbi:MAG: GspH/FimT family pseudopilin [Deltaproteobacteria bacterium]|nr:GspH/FimT family pseudopilin [Deltaproteobacteria bacterium]RLB81358.1 MAG: hypothetical protein DRH17_09395 [Deltaproteobacteria bacterium]